MRRARLHDGGRCRGARRLLRVALLAHAEDAACEPKSVPDWESVGALRCDAAELSKLRASDCRAPLPARRERSAGAAQPRHGRAWRALEALVRRLTAGEEGAHRELPAVWSRIKATYPGLVQVG